jgi:hypothetical protein
MRGDLALAPDVAAVAERLAAGRGAVNGTKNGRQASRGRFLARALTCE